MTHDDRTHWIACIKYKLAVALALSSALGCYEASNGPGSGETHFLRGCSEDARCASGLECVCGVCTVRCNENNTCKDQSEIASCRPSDCSEERICDVECDENEDCADLGSGFRCDKGRCRTDATGPIDSGIGPYQENSNLEIASMEVPAGECQGCYLVNNGVWGFSETAVYVSGYVGLGPGCDCSPNGFLKYFDGQQWEVQIAATKEVSTRDYMDIAWGSSVSDLYMLSELGILHYDGDVIQMGGGPLVQYIGVVGNSADAVVAVGRDGLISRFDGTIWQEVQSGGSTDTLVAVWGASIDDLFAVTEDGRVYRFDGEAWSSQENDMVDMIDSSVDGLNDIWGSSSDQIYAVSGSDHPDIPPGPGTIIRYDGQQWSLQQTVQRDALLAISGSAPDHIYAVGATRDKDTSSRAVIWSYNGELWKRTQLNEIEAFLWDVWCSPSGKCFAVGTDNTFISLNEL